ncbi:FAD dependent oxidoreductase [Vararia minispora EC-137]|uniref:FAD dependent oxidoreductase n=1 Tax=Vararia minispora EC-137 TaxID=1314806 RepID=A0ACB8QWE7_9AGAM|nr:FAD dependent oxidoreductase [Vararia minispora EC-137]
MVAIAKQTDKILIVGAGCFGLSTAYHLLQRGFLDVTIIDRSPSLPAPDAASTDLNKIVRTSYNDSFYTKLAHEAIQAWKDTDTWGDTYHESGVLVIGASTNPSEAGAAAYANDVAIGARLTRLTDAQAIHSMFPTGVSLGPFTGIQGYLNQDGGWAFAAQGVAKLLERVKALGATVVSGKAATELVRREERAIGVRCADGEIFGADLIVLASGSWTACSFPELDLGLRCLATGQGLVTIQLTSEEAERYRDVPVVLDWSSGFYAFPPNHENVIKIAVHSTGYSRYVSGPSNPVSTPQTVTSHGQDGLRIPQEVAKFLREQLRNVYPGLATKPFAMTRICWYTDSPDGDWAIGPHPDVPNVLLATAGSGHAFKFLPNIGNLVADRIEGKMDPVLMEKFAVDREFKKVDMSRRGEVLKDLGSVPLCTPEDLLP